MATASLLLAQVESAIASLLTAIASPGVQEYQLNGRRVRRAEFATTLDALRRQRAELKREIARSRSPLRVARLGRAQPLDR